MTDTTELLDIDAIEKWLDEPQSDAEFRTGAPYAFYALIAEVRQLREAADCGIQYARTVSNTGPSGTASEHGFTERSWHQSATGDTHTSHTLPGRLYVVQCEWCPRAFAAPTKREAMAMFREHEDEMSERETTV